jgi:oligopeptidase A
MNLLSQRDGDIPALGVIAGNVAEPTEDKPALLSIDEVETLFHEFGHLIHFFMMDSEEIGLREVAWDFVELPSQIMENWCHFKNCLDIFAKHWQTGEKLPDELFAKYDASRKFMGATASMRQLSFAKIDLSMHINPQFYLSANSIEEATRETLKVYSRDTSEQAPSILPRFTHLFGDPVGYASGYYSYKWAEVLDADAFTRFEKEGVLNAETGKDFADKILRVGNTINPDEAFRNFMGRDADVEALVNRSVDFSK